MRTMPYNARRVVSLIAALAFAFGISYLGQPPPRETVKKEIPLSLKKSDKSSYGPRDFGVVEVYMPGNSSPLCRITSTTAVRKYFDKSGGYEERTRLDREICQLPQNASNLGLIVTFPYEPEKGTIEHTMDSYNPFNKTQNGWQANCGVKMSGNRKNVSFQAYQRVTQPYDPSQNAHQRNADRVDILLLKK